jgi:hypothetical protein
MRFLKQKKLLKELEVNYEQIESESNGLVTNSTLNSDYKSSLPKHLRSLHKYKLFGGDVFAVPSELIISGEEDEYEKPFSFLASDSEVEVFESEYRPEIPDNFIPFGYLYGATEVVLLDKKRDTVHIFHVSDIADIDWLKKKLKNEICSYVDFIKNIKQQTVTCLINPKNYAEALLIEIRGNDKIYCDYSYKQDTKDLWGDYISICESYINKGFEIHYSSKKLKEILNK